MAQGVGRGPLHDPGPPDRTFSPRAGERTRAGGAGDARRSPGPHRGPPRHRMHCETELVRYGPMLERPRSRPAGSVTPKSGPWPDIVMGLDRGEDTPNPVCSSSAPQTVK